MIIMLMVEIGVKGYSASDRFLKLPAPGLKFPGQVVTFLSIGIRQLQDLLFGLR